MTSVHFQGKPFNITAIQVSVPTNNAKEVEVEWFYEDLQDLLELIPTKRCPLHHRVVWNQILEVTSKFWPWSTKRSRVKANRALPGEHTGHSKHPLPRTQETTLHMDVNIWSILNSDWLYSLQLKVEKLYTDSKNKAGSWRWHRSWTTYCKIQM